MAKFPKLSSLTKVYDVSEEMSGDDIQIGKTASGYPVINKLFTCDSKIWRFTLYSVLQVKKEIIMMFYNTNSGMPFDWDNEQENDTTYEVIFLVSPKCFLDRQENRWKIIFVFKQCSPLKEKK